MAKQMMMRTIEKGRLEKPEAAGGRQQHLEMSRERLGCVDLLLTLARQTGLHRHHRRCRMNPEGNGEVMSKGVVLLGSRL